MPKMEGNGAISKRGVQCAYPPCQLRQVRSIGTAATNSGSIAHPCNTFLVMPPNASCYLGGALLFMQAAALFHKDWHCSHSGMLYHLRGMMGEPTMPIPAIHERGRADPSAGGPLSWPPTRTF